MNFNYMKDYKKSINIFLGFVTFLASVVAILNYMDINPFTKIWGDKDKVDIQDVARDVITSENQNGVITASVISGGVIQNTSPVTHSIQTIGQRGDNYLINESPRAFLLGKRFITLEKQESGYKISFEVLVGNPTSQVPFHIEYPSEVENYDEPILIRSGTRYFSGRQVPYSSFLLNFYSNVRVDQEAFQFSIQ